MEKECICAPDDEDPISGFSVCGVPCPEHPPSKEDIEMVHGVIKVLKEHYRAKLERRRNP